MMHVVNQVQTIPALVKWLFRTGSVPSDSARGPERVRAGSVPCDHAQGSCNHCFIRLARGGGGGEKQFD